MPNGQIPAADKPLLFNLIEKKNDLLKSEGNDTFRQRIANACLISYDKKTNGIFFYEPRVLYLITPPMEQGLIDNKYQILQQVTNVLIERLFPGSFMRIDQNFSEIYNEYGYDDWLQKYRLDKLVKDGWLGIMCVFDYNWLYSKMCEIPLANGIEVNTNVNEACETGSIEMRNPKEPESKFQFAINKNINEMLANLLPIENILWKMEQITKQIYSY